jgi:uncharacterized membrane protein
MSPTNRRKHQRRVAQAGRRTVDSASVHLETNVQLNQASFYTGPVMPAVADLAQYNEVIPNGAERVFD